ncbi:MAG: FAD-binding oxidoreductase [Chloroflexota bacterium]
MRPRTAPDLQRTLRSLPRGSHVSLAGARHAMGGQQFGESAIHVDTMAMTEILSLDPERGIVDVQAGVTWPLLIQGLTGLQGDSPGTWGIVQKQTGADELTLGGALAANIHGRGLSLGPIVDDVESFTLVDPDGELRACSRTEHPELFSLAIGGYGLFGIISTVQLRLRRRRKVRRVVELMDVRDVTAAVETRIREGYLFGDLQFFIDERSDDFMRRGIFSCYLPVQDDTPMPAAERQLSSQDWAQLITLAHTDRARAVELYVQYYLSSSGQLYWSDTHQLSEYLDGYHLALDAATVAPVPGSEMISELYVPRERLPDFMERLRADYQPGPSPVIYGTIRFIEPDTTTVLAWARERWACIVLNLHVDHSPAGIALAAERFRRLIDHARALGGSYYPTYHRWATRDQVLACHPAFPRFLELKRRYDPRGVFQSTWYRHHVKLLGGT